MNHKLFRRGFRRSRKQGLTVMAFSPFKGKKNYTLQKNGIREFESNAEK